MSDFNYNRIKEVLAKKGMKNIQLAAKLKMDQKSVSSWCNNINQPEYPTLFRISEILDVEAGELLSLRKDLRKVEGHKNSKTVVKKKSGKRK